VGRSGATVRQEQSLTSPIVGTMPLGTILHVDIIEGRRARVLSPLKGWVSLSTENGYIIIGKRAEAAEFLPRYKVVAKGGVLVGSSSETSESSIIRLAKYNDVLLGTGCVSEDADGMPRIQVEEGWASLRAPDGTNQLALVTSVRRQ
jgi:hypothetical protein